MPRYKGRPRDDREDRKDRRSHGRKPKGHIQDNDLDGRSANDLGTALPTLISSSRDERNDRHYKIDRNSGISKTGRRAENRPNPRRKHSGPDSEIPDESLEWGCQNSKEISEDKKPVDIDKPNFGLSGKLTEDANTINGVVIKYSEPQNARKPKKRWRLYPFKGEKNLPTLYVHRQSAYLMGRDRKIADIPLDHPSCSKQHAVLQYRLVTFQREGGGEGKRLRPYLIDLESANGTFVNNVKLEPKRYHELLERDVLKFGFSSREYVLLHEQSRDDALDDDVPTGLKTET